MKTFLLAFEVTFSFGDWDESGFVDINDFLTRKGELVWDANSEKEALKEVLELFEEVPADTWVNCENIRLDHVGSTSMSIISIKEYEEEDEVEPIAQSTRWHSPPD